MAARYRVLIAEDQTLVRQGLRALVHTNPDLEVVSEAENGCEAVRLAGETAPDLVLMDLSMPGMNGIEATTEIKARYPKVKVLVVTALMNEECIYACIRAGANGYIVKDATREQFLRAVDKVLHGETYLCAAATEKVVGWFTTGAKTAVARSAWDTLTHRERQILKLVAEGHTNKVMAKFLSISPKTVEKHRSTLMSKLDIHSTAGLTAYAVSKGLTQRFTTLGVTAYALCNWLVESSTTLGLGLTESLTMLA